jgi:hypothetical protein
MTSEQNNINLRTKLSGPVADYIMKGLFRIPFTLLQTHRFENHFKTVVTISVLERGLASAFPHIGSAYIHSPSLTFTLSF